MAVKQRPGVQVNVERTVQQTGKKSVFLDIKPGQTVDLRFTPASSKDGKPAPLFFISAQHHKMKDEGQTRAYACLDVHGTKGQKCPMCTFLDKAVTLVGADAAEKLTNLHGVAYRWHAQVIPVPTEGQEKGDQTYIVGLSKMTADDVSKILKMETDTRQTLLTDPDAGQAIRISRNSATGFATRYKVLPTGLRVSLDEIAPGWENKFLVTETAINLRIDETKFLKAIQETVGVGIFAKAFPGVEL